MTSKVKIKRKTSRSGDFQSHNFVFIGEQLNTDYVAKGPLSTFISVYITIILDIVLERKKPLSYVSIRGRRRKGIDHH